MLRPIRVRRNRRRTRRGLRSRISRHERLLPGGPCIRERRCRGVGAPCKRTVGTKRSVGSERTIWSKRTPGSQGSIRSKRAAGAEWSIRSITAAKATSAPCTGPKHETEADQHQPDRPEKLPDTNRDDALRVEKEPHTDTRKEPPADALSTVACLHDHQCAHQNDRHGPEAQNLIRLRNPKAIERQRKSKQDDPDPENGARRHDERTVLIHVCDATSTYDLIKMLPIMTNPRRTRRGGSEPVGSSTLQSAERRRRSRTLPNTPTACRSTVQSSGTRITTLPIMANTSTIGATPGEIRACRKSSTHEPINAVISAPSTATVSGDRLADPRTPASLGWSPRSDVKPA